jgi:hypothetical protein
MYTLSLQEIVLWCCILVAAGIFFGMCIELKTHTGEHQRKVLQNEVEIGWRCGIVTAGPFIRENVAWTPEQADQFAMYLKSAAHKAREMGCSGFISAHKKEKH